MLVPLVLGLLALGLFLYRFASWPVQDTFRKMGVSTPPTNKIFGHFLEGIRYGLFDVQTKFYPHFKHKKVYGWYEIRSPMLVVCDLDLVKDVFVKHFNCFPDRRVLMDFDEPFHRNLLSLTGEDWKRVRATVSPTFSSSRLKRMSPHVERTTTALLELLAKKAETSEEMELKELMSRMTMDTIAATGFGIDIDTLSDPDNSFNTHAKAFLNPNWLIFLVAMISSKLGEALRWMGMTMAPRKSLNFFDKAITSAVEERRSGGRAGKLGDFLDLMINSEKIREEEGDAGESKGVKKGEQTKAVFSDDEIKAQALLFLMAGYDTVSTVLSFTLFMLAEYPDIQKRVQEEIDQVADQIGLGDSQVFGYSSMQGLNYLEQVINETIRLYPPGVLVDRVCTKDVVLEGGISIPKGMPVVIPIYGIHTDPDIWDEPEQFRPERFEPAACASRHQFAFLPFGQGPRNCVAMRLAQFELKVVLASVLRKFDVKPCGKTVYPPKLVKMSTKAADGLWVSLSPREM